MAKRARPVVSIVGRPNVGKSTFFNRVLRRPDAVVHDEPGVTRDRHAAVAEWEGRSFMLVDTGGLLLDADGVIETRVREQVQAAVGQSDLVLFLTDGRAGPLPGDHEIADLLRRQAVDVILVVNKIDAQSFEAAGLEFAELGMAEMHLVSAIQGRGMDDLIDAIVRKLPDTRPADSPGAIGIAVIGKPNVGKSSLVNALLQEERMIVTEIPGTTRDAIDTHLRFQGRDLTLIDTAGLKRQSRTENGVEYYSALRALRSLEEADVAIVVLDASQPLARQDYRVAAMPFERGRPVVFVFNKWDLVRKETLTSRDIVREGARHLPDLLRAPSIFVSAKSAQRVSRILPAVLEVHANSRLEVDADALNELLDAAVARRSHPYVRGTMIKLFGMRQVGTAPPTFIVYCNRPSDVDDGYRRYLQNAIRGKFPFHGCPLRLLFRRR